MKCGLSKADAVFGEHHTGFARCLSAALAPASGAFLWQFLRLRKRVVKVLLMGVSFGGGGAP